MTGSVYGLPNTKFGTFSQSTMDESGKKGWVVISMKDGWKRTFRSISRRGAGAPQIAGQLIVLAWCETD